MADQTRLGEVGKGSQMGAFEKSKVSKRAGREAAGFQIGHLLGREGGIEQIAGLLIATEQVNDEV